MRELKKIILLFLIFTPAFSFANVGVVKSDGLYMEDKIKPLEELLYKNQEAELSRDRYIKAMTSRINYYMKDNRDLSLAADDLRALLFFLSKNPTSEKYKETKEKFDKVLNLMGYNSNDSERLELAKALYLEKKYFASAYEFQNLLNSNYESYVVSEYLGDIYQKLNNPKQAMYYYQKSVKYHKNNDDVYFKMGLLNLENGQNDSGIENFKTAILLTDDYDIVNKIIQIYSGKLRTEPNNPNYYEILALSYQKINDFDSAYMNFKKALEFAQNDTFIQYDFGKFLQRAGRYSEAIEIYDKILSLNPYESQIRIERAKCYMGLNMQDKALVELQGVLVLYPKSSQAQYEIYKLLNSSDLSFLPKAFYPLDPPEELTSETLYNIGEFAIENGDNQAGIKFFKSAIEKNPKNDKAYISLYKTYEILGEKEKGAGTIKDAYEKFGANSEVQKLYSDLNKDEITRKTELAMSYIKNDDYSHALQIYKQINPKGVNTYFSIANCYKVLKQPKMAIESLKEAHELFPDNSDICYHLAVLFSEQNSPVTAREFLKKSIELDKNNIKAYKFMAYLDNSEADKILDSCYESFKNKDYNTTLNALTKGIEEFPTASSLYYYRGVVYEESGDDEKALKDYRISVKLAPDNITGYYKLGKILDKLGKEREAMEAYEKLLSIEPPMEIVNEIQPRLDYLMKKYY